MDTTPAPESRLDRHYTETVAALTPAPAGPGPARPPPDAPVRAGSGLDVGTATALFDAQLASRHLDLAARWMQRQGRGYYTISSAGHEGNAALAAALRASDPALLHYRSGGFYLARAAQVPGVDAVRDVLLGVAASAEEPGAGGRHKVFGRPELAVVPQTSTIGSHLPRAVGVAWSIPRARRMGVTCPWPGDAVVCCSFGDASVNHSTVAGAVNAACHTGEQGLPLPLLLVCEDNGLGISVPTPRDWVRRAHDGRAGLTYLHADGCDLASTHDTAVRAVELARRHRRPVFLHLSVVRFLGHAGSDAEAAYRSPAEVEADLGRDPLVATARLLVGAGALTPDEAVDRYRAVGDRVAEVAADVLGRRPLRSATEVAAPLTVRGDARLAGGRPPAAPAHRAQPAGPRRTEPVPPGGQPGAHTASPSGPVTLAAAVTATLAEQLQHRAEMVVFGEDVGRKGGVYGLTKGLQRRFGAARVFDTLLDEQAILGLGLGAGLSGLLPVPEVQYLAYLHNAEDQLRGEAATLPFFSQGRFRNPMVLRVAAYAYQRGFGGHFHNDNAVGVLRDVPGLVVASPARPDDAVGMLRSCLDSASSLGTVCVFLEPIALYHRRDLYEDGDDGWLAPYPAERHRVPVGSARTHGDGRSLTLVSFGNGLRISLRAARSLAGSGVDCRVLDLRWLAPLPVADLLREARATGRVLVVDETRRSGGVSEGVLTALVDGGFTGPMSRVTSADCFVPLGPAAELVLVSEDDVVRAARRLLGG